MKEKVLRSVVSGFLGTYTSRYSDKEGYWPFGYIVADIQKLDFDLLKMASTADGPVADAMALAQTRFHEQIKKHGLELSAVGNAHLFIERIRQRTEMVVSDARQGWDLKFELRVVSASGKEYRGSETIFVAPHDEGKELRRPLGGS